jgi:hypothetical protein
MNSAARRWTTASGSADLPPDAVALLALARPRLIGEARATLCAELASNVDWTWLVEQALSHGLGALLCRHLTEMAGDLVPDDIAMAAATYSQDRASFTETAVIELAELVDTLAASGIRALPFKGPVFGAQAYGDPSLRVFGDLDLLIATEDVTAALATLDQFGYRSDVADLSPRRLRDYHRYNGQDALFAAGRMPVEPHWAFAPRTLSMAFDPMPLWARAGSIDVHGRTLPCVAPEDALLIACGGKEQWSRLSWIADVAALMQAHTLNWTAILERAGASGQRRMVFLGARLAERLLDAALPDPLPAAIIADPAVDRLADRVRNALFAGSTAASSVFQFTGFRWSMRERWSDRLRYLSRTLLTARVTHFRSLDLPDELAFLYPAIRLGHDFLALPRWKALHSEWA